MNEISWKRVNDELRNVERAQMAETETAMREFLEAIHAAHDRLRQRLQVVAMGGEDTAEATD